MRYKEKEYYLKKKYLQHHYHHHFHPHLDFEDRFDTEDIFEHHHHFHPHLDFEDSFDEEDIFKHHYHPDPKDYKEMERYKYLHHKNIKIFPNKEMIYMKERYKDMKHHIKAAIKIKRKSPKKILLKIL